MECKQPELLIKGKIITKESSSEVYEKCLGRWNSEANSKNSPALIVFPENVEDVIASVKYAQLNNLGFAVKGGGHSVASVTVGGLLLDLSAMKSVSVDVDSKTVKAQGGCILRDVDDATSAHGFAVPFGHVSHTGIGGLTLGGGIGHLVRSCGLTVDNLLSVEIVTANAEKLIASSQENTDLFWAVRGAGTNFGVVTEFTFKLNPVKEVLVGTFVYPLPLSKAPLLEIGRLQDAKAIPNELSYSVSITPEGCVIMGIYNGDFAEGTKQLESFSKVGSPVVNVIRPVPYNVLQKIIDDKVPHGIRYYQKGPFLKSNLNEHIIDSLLESYNNHPTKNVSLLLTHLQGAVADVPPTATPYYFRDATYQIIFMSFLIQDDTKQSIVKWTHDSIEKLSGHTYGDYVNSTDIKDLSHVYVENWDRLVELKKRYDPTNFFNANYNIKI